MNLHSGVRKPGCHGSSYCDHRARTPDNRRAPGKHTRGPQRLWASEGARKGVGGWSRAADAGTPTAASTLHLRPLFYAVLQLGPLLRVMGDSVLAAATCRNHTQARGCQHDLTEPGQPQTGRGDRHGRARAQRMWSSEPRRVPGHGATRTCGRKVPGSGGEGRERGGWIRPCVILTEDASASLLVLLHPCVLSSPEQTPECAFWGHCRKHKEEVGKSLKLGGVPEGSLPWQPCWGPWSLRTPHPPAPCAGQVGFGAGDWREPQAELPEASRWRMGKASTRLWGSRASPRLLRMNPRDPLDPTGPAAPGRPWGPSLNHLRLFESDYFLACVGPGLSRTTGLSVKTARYSGAWLLPAPSPSPGAP